MSIFPKQRLRWRILYIFSFVPVSPSRDSKSVVRDSRFRISGFRYRLSSICFSSEIGSPIFFSSEIGSSKCRSSTCRFPKIPLTSLFRGLCRQGVISWFMFSSLIVGQCLLSYVLSVLMFNSLLVCQCLLSSDYSVLGAAGNANSLSCSSNTQYCSYRGLKRTWWLRYTRCLLANAN